MGFMTLPPRMIGKRKNTAIALRTMFTAERNRVIVRMFSKAFHALAFLRGLPSQTDLMTRIQRTSMAIVIAVNNSNYELITVLKQHLVWTYCASSFGNLSSLLLPDVLDHVIAEESHGEVVVTADDACED